jgi:hypothetical protein
MVLWKILQKRKDWIGKLIRQVQEIGMSARVLTKDLPPLLGNTALIFPSNPVGSLRYDKIFVMDDMNLRDVLKLVRNEDDHEKVSLLLENAIVPDPYYEDDLFDDVFKMIEKGCKAIIEREK